MNLTEYLNTKPVGCYEGYSQQMDQQVKDLVKLTQGTNIRCMEIGFNAGHSAEVLLKHNTTLTLTSFDLGEYASVDYGKDYIDNYYPRRHTLILGDSRVTLPEFAATNQQPFDIIFIDGGHTYEVAESDLKHCYKLAHKDTILIMDDVVYTKGMELHYTVGPTQAWTEYVSSNRVQETGRSEYAVGRGMVWGKYIQ